MIAPLKLSLSVASLRLPLPRGLETASRLGVYGVEIDARNQLNPREFSQTGLRQLRKMLDDLNLRVVSLAFPTRRGYQIAEDLERRVDATKEVQRLAWDLGCRWVVNHIGRIPEDADDPARTLLAEALLDLERHGDRVGAYLLARTGSEPGPRMARLFDELGLHGTGVDFDPGGLIAGGFSVEEALVAVGSRVRHVHCRDATFDRVAHRGMQTQLGRGSVDLESLLGRLEEFDYRGAFCLEPTGALDAEEEASAAVGYLQSIVE